MDYWRPEREARPEVVSVRNFVIALGLHVGLFLVFWLFAICHGLFDRAEEVIPIDLTVIVNENLDGKENEPPPLNNVTPPPPPKPEPKKVEPKKVEEPKPLEQMVIDKKKPDPKKPEPKKPEPKKEEPKKVEPPKEEPPKKTAKELREERMKRIQEATKKAKIQVKDVPSGDGKTAKKTLSDAEIQKLLNQGYRPGTTEQLAANELSRCLSLIQRALNDKWSQMLPNTGQSGLVVLSVRLNSAGGFSSVSLKKSCGDRLTDSAVVSVAKAVGHISGLSDEFKTKYRNESLTVNYRVN